MITIDLKIPMTVTVPDARGIGHVYDLVAGLNEVPKEVAAHWYVAKFLRPVRRVPRVVIPSSARRAQLPKPVIAQMAAAIAPLAPAAEQTAAPEAPAVKDTKAKA